MLRSMHLLTPILLALMLVMPGGPSLAETRDTAVPAQIPPVLATEHVQLAQLILPQTVKSKKSPTPAPRKKPALVPPPPPPDPEIGAWKLCSNNAEIAPCDAYLVVYPTGKWADLARQRKAVLVAALVPIPAAPPVNNRANNRANDRALEKTNWLSCKDGKVFGACENYLRSHPKGRWVRDAQSRAREASAAIAVQRIAQKEKADWDNCASNSLVGLCERFLVNYPTSERKSAARDRIMKLGLGATPK